MRRITAPAVEPISLAQIKLHRRITHTDEDALLSQQIQSARSYCEKHQQRAYITQTWRIALDRFPCGREIRLPLPPLQSVNEIVYFDLAGVQRTLSTSVYSVDTFSEPGRIFLKPNQSFPATECGRFNAVEIEFVAGYGSAATDVPPETTSAIYLLCGHLYENREHEITGTISTELKFSIDALLSVTDWGRYS